MTPINKGDALGSRAMSAIALTLEQHAAVAAQIAEGSRPVGEILQSLGLSELQWSEATQHWMRVLAEDVRENGVGASAPQAYAEAFTREQDALAPIPELSVEEWASLQLLVEAAGDPRAALVARRVSFGDWIRLNRHWARRLATDAALRARYDVARSAPAPSLS